jgi:RES domain-containing protein
VLVAIDIPDACQVYSPALTDLPPGWETMPTSSAAQMFGGAWITSASSLAMAVPSVIIPDERNILLNPSHPDYAKVTMAIIRPFVYDERMKKP